MGAHSYEDLKYHIGHRIVCVGYGEKDAKGRIKDPVNVAVECETCYEVLMDYDKGSSDLNYTEKQFGTRQRALKFKKELENQGYKTTMTWRGYVVEGEKEGGE